MLGTIFYTKILPTIQTDYSSLDERGEIWKISAELLEDPDTELFGLGYGQFQYHYETNVAEILQRQPLDYYVLQPHNIFLLFTFNFGVVGLIFILFCLGKMINRLIHSKKYTNLTITSLFILGYFFIHGLIDSPFFKNDMLILLLLFMELSLISNQKQDLLEQDKDSLT